MTFLTQHLEEVGTEAVPEDRLLSEQLSGSDGFLIAAGVDYMDDFSFPQRQDHLTKELLQTTEGVWESIE